MPYNSNETSILTHIAENLQDWQAADPGQWFIGVVDTHNRRIYIVPVNIFERSGALNQGVLNNNDQRGMNRYASGAPGNRNNQMKNFNTYAGPGGNWMNNRGPHQTHHVGVAVHYGANQHDCLGFTLVKINNNFAQLKMGSNSLNGGKPGVSQKPNFSAITRTGNRAMVGSIQMPDGWALAIKTYLENGPFGITNIAISND